MKNHKFFFTFGTLPSYPFKKEEYVVVEAEDEDAARKSFKGKFPHKDDPEIINCAFIYNERNWPVVREMFYKGKDPVCVVTEKDAEYNSIENAYEQEM